MNPRGVRPLKRARRDQPTERQTWIKRYSGQTSTLRTSFGHFVPEEDGGYFLIGALSGYSPLKYGFFVLKLSSNGHVEWRRAWSGTTMLSLKTVSRTSDGGFIVGGEAPGPGGGFDLLAFKLSPDGGLDWARFFDRQGGDDRFGGLRQTSDGGYLLTGSTQPSFGSDEEGLVIKVSSNGEPVWQKTCREHQFVWVGFGESWETPDGGFIVRGGASAGAYGERTRIVFLKLTSSGDVEWQKAFSGDSGSRYTLRNLLPTADGGFLLNGRVELDIHGQGDEMIMKMTPGCDVEWQQVCPRDPQTSFRVLHQRGDGGFLVLGDTWVGNIGWHILLLRLTPAGEIEWQRKYGARGAGEFLSTPEFVHQIPGGGYVLGTGNPSLLKVSAEGEIERMPGVSSPGTIGFYAGYPEPFSSSLTTQVAPLTFSTVPYAVWDAPIKEELVFAAPVNLSVQTLLNRSLAQGEYYNELSWGLNPMNDDIVIASYEIFYMASEPSGAGSGGLLAVVDGDQHSYRHLHPWMDKLMTYTLVAIGRDGGRSLPAETQDPPGPARRR